MGLAVEEAARTTYTYDPKGNTQLVEAGADRKTFTWDGENRLTLLEAGAIRYTSTYDGDGLRRQWEVATTKTRYIWDGQDVLLETKAAGSRFYHGDALGSVTELTDAAEAVVNTLRYRPWGEMALTVGGDPPTRRWVGKLGYHYHPNTDLKLYYVRGRWYSPEVGRWLSQDPLGVLGTAYPERLGMPRGFRPGNLAYYVGNKPANWGDPMGLQTEEPTFGFEPWPMDGTGPDLGIEPWLSGAVSGAWDWLKLQTGYGYWLESYLDYYYDEPMQMYYENPAFDQWDCFFKCMEGETAISCAAQRAWQEALAAVFAQWPASFLAFLPKAAKAPLRGKGPTNWGRWITGSIEDRLGKGPDRAWYRRRWTPIFRDWKRGGRGARGLVRGGTRVWLNLLLEEAAMAAAAIAGLGIGGVLQCQNHCGAFVKQIGWPLPWSPPTE